MMRELLMSLVFMSLLDAVNGHSSEERRKVCGGDWDCINLIGSGSQLRLELPPLSKARVKDLQNKMPEWMDPPKDRRAFFHKGKRMQMDKALRDYGVQLLDDVVVVDSHTVKDPEPAVTDEGRKFDPSALQHALQSGSANIKIVPLEPEQKEDL